MLLYACYSLKSRTRIYGAALIFAHIAYYCIQFQILPQLPTLAGSVTLRRSGNMTEGGVVRQLQKLKK